MVQEASAELSDVRFAYRSTCDLPSHGTCRNVVNGGDSTTSALTLTPVTLV